MATTTKKKELPICGECIKSSNTTDLKEEDYCWVKKPSMFIDNKPTFFYYILLCGKCAKKTDMDIIKPYKITKKRGRPKKE